MKPNPTKELVDVFTTVPGLSSIEKVLETVTLPDGRSAQLTYKLDTDVGQFIGSELRTEFDKEQNAFVTTDGKVRLVVPLTPIAEPDYVEA